MNYIANAKQRRLRACITLVAIGIALGKAPIPALAVEGGLGRSLPGVWVMPQGAVVGPTPGFSFTVLPTGYMGSISGARQIPLSGSLVADISADSSANYLVPQVVYKTETTKVSLASTFMASVNWVGVTGSVQTANLTRSRSSANAGLSDIIVSPLTVGVHFSPTNNLALSTMIFAPTGAYAANNLSNMGMGMWTFSPNVAHTYLWPAKGIEIDNYVGFDVYTRNQTTNYSSGTVFHWDGMLLKYAAKNRAGFGAIVSNLTQITRDRGALADLLHGFEGRAWGAGPVILFVAKAEKPGVAIQFRWVPEFAVTNLLKGNTLMLGLTLKLN